MSKQAVIEKETYKKLEKPKSIDFSTLIDLVGFLPPILQNIFNTSITCNDELFAWLIALLLISIINYILFYIKFTKFYNNYSVQHEKLIEEITQDNAIKEKLEENSKNIKQLEKESCVEKEKVKEMKKKLENKININDIETMSIEDIDNLFK